MSADDAQQNIPMGHVAKMRQAVDELNRAKRVKTGVKTGVEIVPVSRGLGFRLQDRLFLIQIFSWSIRISQKLVLLLMDIICLKYKTAKSTETVMAMSDRIS